MSKNLEIRMAGVADAALIAAVGGFTFKETYGKSNPRESVEEYINTMFAPEKIKEEILAEGELFIIAFLDQMPVGFVKMRNNRSPKGISDKHGIEIQRIYVLKDYQGFRVGKELIDFCTAFAMQNKYDLIWLQVWQNNNGAIRFYQKSGFVIYETTEFTFGKETHQDFLLKKELYY